MEIILLILGRLTTKISRQFILDDFKPSKKMGREFGFWTVWAKPSRICYFFIIIIIILIFFFSSGHSFYVLPKISSGSTGNPLENWASSVLLGFNRSLVSSGFHRKSTKDPVTRYISQLSKNSSQIKPKNFTIRESSQFKPKNHHNL